MECNCGTTTNLLMAADFADPVWCAVCKVNLDLDEMPVSDALKREIEDWVKDYGRWIDWDNDVPKSEAVKVRQAVYGIMQNKSNKIGVIKLKPINCSYSLAAEWRRGRNKLSCLEREMMEETGYSISNLVYVCKGAQYFQSRDRRAYIQNVADFYSCFVGASIRDSIEADHELIWISPEEAVDRLFHEHQAWAIRCHLGLPASEE
ncbi:hypothetical protein [Terribacillus halophilus]|uniref:hypothetical protein n=1 Tax=Terribacillus halophilus TaxID=361279 RepID=UPI00117FA349|nr:hypothetical protein [Terribacillus halophilus]